MYLQFVQVTGVFVGYLCISGVFTQGCFLTITGWSWVLMHVLMDSCCVIKSENALFIRQGGLLTLYCAIQLPIEVLPCECAVITTGRKKQVAKQQPEIKHFLEVSQGWLIDNS